MWWKFCQDYDLNELNKLVKEEDDVNNLMNDLHSGKQNLNQYKAIKVNPEISEQPSDPNIEFLPDNIYDLLQMFNSYKKKIDMVSMILSHNDFDNNLKSQFFAMQKSIQHLSSEIEYFWAYVKEKDELLQEMDYSQSMQLYDDLTKKDNTKTKELATEWHRTSHRIYHLLLKIINQLPVDRYRTLLKNDYLPDLKPNF